MRLKELRINKGYSQEKVAKILGVARTTITNYENGESKPDIEMLVKIANIFKCSIDYLLENDFDTSQQKQLTTIEPKEKSKLTEKQRECVEIIKIMTPKQVERVYYFMLGLTQQN